MALRTSYFQNHHFKKQTRKYAHFSWNIQANHENPETFQKTSRYLLLELLNYFTFD